MKTKKGFWQHWLERVNAGRQVDRRDPFKRICLLFMMLGGLLTWFGCSDSTNPLAPDESLVINTAAISTLEMERNCVLPTTDFSLPSSFGCVEQGQWGMTHTKVLLDFYPWFFDKALPTIRTANMDTEEAWKYVRKEFRKRYHHDWMSIDQAMTMMDQVRSPENVMLDFLPIIDQAVAENWELEHFANVASDFADQLPGGRNEQVNHQVEVMVSSYYVHQQTGGLRGLDEAGFVLGCDGLGGYFGGPFGAAGASLAALVYVVLSD